MSDSIWLKRTNRGKVVYESSRPLEDRPTHFFECADIERILRKSDCGHYIIPADLWVRFDKEFDAFLRGFVRRADRPVFEFGGGEFGGGGATRDFDEISAPDAPGRIFILKEG